ncbi:MAG: 4Fe-4S ferredoxin [Candidatus Bathyarchaeia archaeon]
MELLTINVRNRQLSEAALLIHGTCVEKDAPKTFNTLAKGRIPLHVCLEKAHMNVVGFKLATILQTSKPKEIVVLTLDGSPHCIQLHFTAEQVKRVSKSNANIKHYVLEKGKLIEISRDAVEIARHLSKVQEICSQKQ